MNKIILSTFNSLIKEVAKHNSATTIYRGVTHESYDLRPKIGRVSIKKSDRLEDVEKRIMRRFVERSVPYLQYKPNDDPWEWMVLAQHHGLPTRLLDWSRNPLVAAFFAVEREILEPELQTHSGNSAIYVFNGRTVISKGNLPKANKKYSDGPFKVARAEKFAPSHIDARIIAQTGVFTVHPDPTNPNPFKLSNLSQFIIPLKSRKEWKKMLHSLGINRASLFPDLDNLAKHIEWLCTVCY